MPDTVVEGPRPLSTHLTPALDSIEKVRAFVECAEGRIPPNIFAAIKEEVYRCRGHLQQEITQRMEDFGA